MSTAPAQDTGRVAVITGASSGIGEATARALATSGHRIALLARRADRIQALADELGNGAIAIQADVTDRDSLVKAADRVKAELGGTDILVNNAGIMLLAPFTAEGHDDHRTWEYVPDAATVVGGLTQAQLEEVERLASRIANAVAVRRIGMPGWFTSTTTVASQVVHTHASLVRLPEANTGAEALRASLSAPQSTGQPETRETRSGAWFCS